MKKILKISGYFFAAVFAIAILLVLFTQTGWFKDIVKDQVESIANENLNGTLSIGEIEGSIFGDLQVYDIRIIQNDATFLYCRGLGLDYSLAGILSNNIKINFVIVDSLYLNLKQIDDSTWNAALLVKPTDDAEPDTSASDFDWSIFLNLFEIRKSKINIYTLDTASVIPEEIGDINLKASASITPETKQLEIGHFSLNTSSPNMTLRDLLLDVKMKGEKVELQSLSIETSANKINMSGEYFVDNSGVSNLSFKTSPINFNELESFMPGINISGNPIFTMSGKYQNNGAEFKVNISENLQTAEITANINDLNSKPSYQIQSTINNINAGYWINDTSMTTDINAFLNIAGSGTSLEELTLNADMNIYDSKLINRTLDTLSLNAKIDRNNVESNINLQSEFGSLDGLIEVTGLSDTQKFKFSFDIKQLNTAPLLLNDSLQSNLNFNLSGAGQKFAPDEMTGSVSLALYNSTLTDYTIDSLSSDITINKGVYTIDRFRFVNDAAELNAAGRVSQYEQNDISFNLLTKDLAALPPLKDFENLNFNGSVNGRVYGKPDSIFAALDYQFSKISFQTNSAEKLSGTVDAEIIKDSIDVKLNTSVDNIDASGTLVKRVELDAQYWDSRVNSDLRFVMNDTASGNIKSEVFLDSVITVLLPEINLNISNYTWQNQNDSIGIKLAGEKYQIDNFNLSNGKQSISVSGTLDLKNNSDINLKIENLNVKELLNVSGNTIEASAIVNADIKFSGNQSNPTAIGKLEISEIGYEQFEIGDIKTEFELKEEVFNWDFELIRKGNTVVSNGFIPLQINGENGESVIPGDKPLSINLKIDSLDLAELPNFNDQLDDVKGKIRSDIKLHNSLDHLEADGFFRIDDAAISSSAFGISYDKLTLNFEADSQKIYLKDFTIKSDGGSLNVDGYVGYPDGLLAGKLDPLEVNVEANEFEIAETQNYEAKIDGGLQFRNESGEAKFDGKITLLRSRFYLPYFTETSEKQFNKNQPLLIKELEENKAAIDTLKLAAKKKDRDSVKTPEFIKNITGRFTLSIPKNTWLASPQLNIELSGDLDVVKNGAAFELFGDVNVVRGKLEVYGKDFKIIEGRIIFNGGSKLNPELVMTLEFMFRAADRSKKYLRLSVRGTAQDPKLSFTLDGTEIDEGNAISYLVFGKSLDELTQSQRSNVSSSKEDLAKSLAGSFLAAQLSSTLGDALGLDVIEIKGGDSWKSSSLTAGKYLTDDLFVSYERGFGSAETNEVNPRIVTLEYELTRFLFFQLVEGNDKTSGFDAIIKFNW